MLRRVGAPAAFILIAVVAAGLARISRPDATGEMAVAASRFLDSLSPDLRAKASLAYDSPARKDWRFVPGDRAGVWFKEMNDAQRTAARDLLRSALSAQGMLKVEGIMELDAVLRDMERARGGSGASRDPERYAVAVFGTPGTAPWGWKVEGHHVSLNFSIIDGGWSHTPWFLGANPGEVRSGPKAGTRVLRLEEQLARELVASMGAEQRALAVISPTAPPDVLLVAGRSFESVKAEGVAYESMSDDQKKLIDRLLQEYVSGLRPDLGTEWMARAVGAHAPETHFAWAGGLEPGQGHYYRIQGPSFVIEYDNTQDGANHIHTVWHDLGRSFGGDPLREHLEEDHGVR